MISKSDHREVLVLHGQCMGRVSPDSAPPVLMLSFMESQVQQTIHKSHPSTRVHSCSGGSAFADRRTVTIVHTGVVGKATAVAQGTPHLKIAKVLFAQLHLFLEPSDLGLCEAAGDALDSLAGAPVGAHVKVELEGVSVRLQYRAYLLPCFYRLLMSLLRLAPTT